MSVDRVKTSTRTSWDGMRWDPFDDYLHRSSCCAPGKHSGYQIAMRRNRIPFRAPFHPAPILEADTIICV